MRYNKPGFIMLMTFLMLTLGMMIGTQLYFKGTIYSSYVSIVKKREAAKELAQSGIQIALNQLALYDKKIVPEKEDAQQAKKPEVRQKDLLKTLLYVQNRWQTFQFNQEKDGLEGELKICITSEDGKIPLGALIDYQKKEFIKKETAPTLDGKKILEEIAQKMNSFVQDKDFFEGLIQFIKKRKTTPTDITDLFLEKSFDELRDQIFYEPSQVSHNDEIEKEKIYLADIFTLWTQEATVNPWLLSPSVQILLQMQKSTQKEKMNIKQIDELLEKLKLKNFKVEKEWDTYLKELYGKEYKSLAKEFAPLLSSKFEPRVFSVVCYGKVGEVIQKLVAIIERIFSSDGEVFEVKKIYWL